MAGTESILVSVIVPARNEEACLGLCLESLVTQTGVVFEIIVVDDGSTDRTAEIARSFADGTAAGIHPRPGQAQTSKTETKREGTASAVPLSEELKVGGFSPRVTVISAPPLPNNWTGKNNAMAAGAKIAKGKWLLFTDADTVHKPGSLARAVAEAEEHGVALLSYSPEQETRTFWEKAVMPVIFAELAATYPPAKVRDPGSTIAAANGQYLMISREAYDAVGGHAKIASDLLEDVAMARLVKSSGRKIWFRYGGDAVRTRMYRTWPQMKEGWTKNLALLFKHPTLRAAMLLVFWVFSWVTFAIGATAIFQGDMRLAYYVLPLLFLYLRVAWGRFGASANLAAIAVGMPMDAFLLVNSARRHRISVVWKGRTYQPQTNSAIRDDAASNASDA